MNHFLIPYETFTLSSRLSVKEVNHRVDCLLERCKPENTREESRIKDFQAAFPYYDGMKTDKYFQFARAAEEYDGTGEKGIKTFPVFKGTVSGTYDTEIRIQIREPYITYMGSIFYSLLSLFFLINACLPKPVWKISLWLSMFIFIQFPVIMVFSARMFKRRSKEIRENLKTLFEAEETNPTAQ
jgi:hypothetical protein